MEYEDLKTYRHSKHLAVILVLFFLAIVPLSFILFEYRVTVFDAGHAVGFFSHRPLMFVYNCLLFLLPTLFFIVLTRSIWVGAALQITASYILSFIQIEKFKARGFNLIPDDFAFINQAEGMIRFIGWSSLARIILVSLCIIAFSVYLHRRAAALRPHQLLRGAFSRRWIQVLALIVVALAFKVATWPLVGLHDPQNNTLEDALARKIEPHMSFLHNNTTYYSNGFLVDFIYNSQVGKMKKPEGYSEVAIQKVVSKYSAIASQANAQRIDLESEDISLVFVLNESYFDPNGISDEFPYDGGNAVEQLHRLQSKNDIVSSSLISPSYGGGTDSVEFEVLTGFSSSYLTTSPYNSVVSHLPGFPSIVSFLCNCGYSSTALHPFEKGMYQRPSVYQNFGFNSFLGQEDFVDAQKNANSEYISDESVVDKILGELSKGGKQFIHVVTMQNHMPYGNVYPTHHYKSQAKLNKEENLAIEDYLQSLYDSDEAAGRLFDEIQKLNKKVLLVFYGDHLPGIYHGLQEVDWLSSRRTPLLMYANFEQEGITSEVQMTPNNIPNDALNYLNAQKPGFYYFLDDLREKEPIVFQGKGPLADKAESLLDDYELLSYDLISGEQYSVEMGFYR